MIKGLQALHWIRQVVYPSILFLLHSMLQCILSLQCKQPSHKFIFEFLQINVQDFLFIYFLLFSFLRFHYHFPKPEHETVCDGQSGAEVLTQRQNGLINNLQVHWVLGFGSPTTLMLFCVEVVWISSRISFRLWLTAIFPPPGTILASSHTATPAMPSPPWRTDTPCAGQTSLGSSCALVGRSSSANHITQTWVRAASLLKPPPQPAFLACSTCEACLCTLEDCPW